MKLSINKLGILVSLNFNNSVIIIANDIINYGMDQASQMEDGNNANYTVSLDTYLKDFDEDTQKYILKNIDSIIEDINASECVLDLVVEKEDKNIELNMIFYWENLLNEVDKKIDTTARSMGVEMDLKDIKEMSADILDDDAFNDDIISKIKYFDNEHDKELSY